MFTYINQLVSQLLRHAYGVKSLNLGYTIARDCYKLHYKICSTLV